MLQILFFLCCLLPLTLADWFHDPFDLTDQSFPEETDIFALPSFGRRSPVDETPEHFSVTIPMDDNNNNDNNNNIIENLQVQIQDNGQTLQISGMKRIVVDDYHSFTSTFRQRFALDPTVLVDQLVAVLQDNNVLQVSAPKDPSKARPGSWNIPIQEGALPEIEAKEDTSLLEEPKEKPEEEEAREAFLRVKKAEKESRAIRDHWDAIAPR